MATTDLKSDNYFEMMKVHLATDAGKQICKKIGYVYQINIAPKKIGVDEVSYIVDLKKGEVTKGKYEGGNPDATFYFKDDDFMSLAHGKMNPQIAFMRGKLKVKGSLSAAQKFTPDIFPKPAKLSNAGRLAMMVMLGIFVHAYVAHAGPIDNLVEHLSNPWQKTIIQTLANNTS